MIKYIVAFVLTFLSVISLADSSLTSNNSTLETKKLELEVKKLSLEINAAQRENTRRFISLTSVIIGSLLGVGTLVWSVFQGVQAFKGRTEENRINRVSSLLGNLSSSDIDVRLGAVRGLSQYSSYAIHELLSSASTESQAVVRTSLEEAIGNIDNKYRQEVVDANSRSILKRMQSLGRLKGFGHDPSKNDNHLNSYKQVKKQYNDTYEHGLVLGRLYRSKNDDESLVGLQIEQELELIRSEIRLANVTSSVICSWIRAGVLESLTSEALDLSESNMYRAKLPIIKSTCFIALYALMRHSTLRYASIENGVFDHSDMLDANIPNSKFIKTSFHKAHLRKATGKNVNFYACDLNDSVLSQGDFSGSHFNNSFCKKTKFRNAILSNVKFTNTMLNEAEFQDANLVDSILSGAKLFGANLVDADLSRVKARNCKFNGADLRGAVFKDADLSGADFSGANISGADFKGAVLDKVDLSKAQNLDKAINFA
ncbi:pentapeptide repeat-containing protein [Halomonas korlensis]|uniref:Uncharacterized protein YjbI, contains pentapeptide repeats n=1 Tax=Halomonas korlensis TaxID=463301 RepID=A0A1I7IL48_9GAMM|nr:pentapeptide repeat-containing protein [Halomonas korlensis]SFU73626.1 Uncharacterized protein YjbI, contains pentapeptide repeats [Halomonas korlensis]